MSNLSSEQIEEIKSLLSAHVPLLRIVQLVDCTIQQILAIRAEQAAAVLAANAVDSVVTDSSV